VSFSSSVKSLRRNAGRLKAAVDQKLNSTPPAQVSRSTLALLCRTAGGDVIEAKTWGNREALALTQLSIRTQKVPADPSHPLHPIAIANDPNWPIHTAGDRPQTDLTH
jgi:hypothetical protein